MFHPEFIGCAAQVAVFSGSLGTTNHRYNGPEKTVLVEGKDMRRVPQRTL